MTGTPDPDHEPVVIGVAGAVASGKSEVARAFARLGFVHNDADRHARDVLRSEDARREIVRWWGPDVLDERGEIDRARVADIVFRSEPDRRRLESLIHPVVAERREQELEEARRSGAPGLVIDAPLLFEVGLDRRCDAVVFVQADDAVRARRVAESRGWSADELRRRDAAQMSADEKRRRSDFLIDNSDASADELDRRAREIYTQTRSRDDRPSRRPAT